MNSTKHDEKQREQHRFIITGVLLGLGPCAGISIYLPCLGVFCTLINTYYVHPYTYILGQTFSILFLLFMLMP